MGNIKQKQEHRAKRQMRIRKRISGTAAKPRISVFRSNSYLYAQAIDDVAGKTLAAVKSEYNPKVADAEKLGKSFGEKLQKAGVKTAVFDRSGYAYHGRLAGFVNGLRESNLTI
jgi:large subunit ribosomal protein L18